MSATKEEHKVDRSCWAAGPWDKEPEDKREWRHNGMPCMMVRNPMGAWCGYVGITREHPLFGQSYGSEGIDELQVHGGITYGDKCQGPICHVPLPGESDDVWWLGFDCAHGFDVLPSISERNPFRTLTDIYAFMGFRGLTSETAEYRNVDYVVAEVEKLADQLRALA